ncbi:MAG TPA: hypothetical protein P5120_04615 [Spirochaetota bacterium]|nr:hypothetical protein [Spirochaetota bacterium]HPF05902.1 hypothetical protein [Spirochaetota bacterium]HPJ42431.1 hypothetical protein [Spirochaetota bacterium]HPR37635.1 hypothetical protein [Spirochaetota bacterium]HRX46780.1 hypothetical protein [Spirochaetota bacterium]
MKQKVIMSLLCALFMLVFSNGFAQSDEKQKEEQEILPEFQFLLTGDMGYAPNKKMNDFSKSMAESVAEQYNLLAEAISEPGGFSVTDSSKADINFGADLEMRFWGDRVGFGFGTGFHYTESSASVTSPHWPDNPEYTLSLLVIPVSGTLYFRQPVSQNSFLALGVGAGYYFGFLDGELESDYTIPHQVAVPEPISDGTCIGYHAKIEYNYVIGNLNLCGGIAGRYVKFSEFEESGVTYKIDAGLTGVSIYAGAGISI